jgi:hypothetical protein
MSSVKDTGKNSKKGGKTGLIIGITLAVIVILALVGVIIYLVVSKGKESEPAQEAAEETMPDQNDNVERPRDVLVTEDNVEEVLGQLREEDYTEPGYYTVTMNYEWHFPSGDAESTDAYVENVAGNTNDVYFDVYLADDEENVIYKSPIIPRGGHIRDFKLDTPLEKGTYDCICEYNLVDENQNSLSNVSMAVQVIVEN